jgi:S1-C subfamily serine protease
MADASEHQDTPPNAGPAAWPWSSPATTAPGTSPTGTSPWSSPSPGPVIPPAAGHDGKTGRRRGTPWLAVALVAALVGAVVGGLVGGVVATSGQRTIVEQFRPTRSDLGVPGAPVDVAAIIQKVLPAVVSIQTTSFEPSVVGDETVVGAGSGMIVTPSGEVLTNNHVVAGAVSVRVTLYGQTVSHPGKVIGTDPANDMALVQIEGVHGLPTVHFARPSSIALGAGVVAIGNALALAPGSPSVTSGIVSGLDRAFSAQLPDGYTEHITGAIQTDAAINPGNSGGPLVDVHGHVIGMDAAVASSSPGNAPAQNVGFAIPVTQLEAELPKLEAGAGRPTAKTYLGVVVTSITPALQAEFGLPATTGALVLEVVPGSPAAAAGLVAGDVIVGLDGQPIDSPTALVSAVQHHAPGQQVTLAILADGKTRTVSVTLGSEELAVP